jgi:hypothetical protein
MSARNSWITALLASAALIILLPSNAKANDTECAALLTGTFDNIVVPPGQTCNLTNATVLGNVKAFQDSRLSMFNTTVLGNVETDKADIVQMILSTVRQNISIKEGGPAGPPAPSFNVCRGSDGNFTPCEVLILLTLVEQGDVQIEKMVGTILIEDLEVRVGNLTFQENSIEPTEVFRVTDTIVGGNLQVLKTTGAGNKVVVLNAVGENLQCFENDPPFVGQPNTARQAEGQCASPPAP